MELAYVYIKGYRNFDGMELNFSQEVSVHYNAEENSLTAKRKENVLPNDFWGENINSLTMLVGNNGAGKTGLMQCIISLFKGMIEQEKILFDFILVLREDKKLYYCAKIANDVAVQCSDKFIFEKIKPFEMSEIFVKSKLIYLTNAICPDDVKRCQQQYYGRYSYLYDCSIGGLVSSNAKIDVNGEERRRKEDFSEVEAYFQHEQYKQVKFVFDKNQYQILQEMKDNQYPVPVPQMLYIELLTDSQLDDFWSENEIAENIKTKCFAKKYLRNIMESYFAFEKNIKSQEIFYTKLLQYLFCCSCLWGMIRSIARRMNSIEKKNFKEKLEEEFKEKDQPESEFCEVSDKIWSISEQSISSNELSPDRDWDEFVKEGKPHYNIFFQYIENEAHLEKYMKMGTPIDKLEESIKQRGSILLYVSTTENTEWFIEFIKKYRYATNPDYFLNFHWGLSSGENNLLSTFASFYFIFDADYTNERKGEYIIYNSTKKRNGKDVITDKEENTKNVIANKEKKRGIKCDNIILLIDEADLTYHPEWQREYISLLTAFLVRIYPPSCCKNIQIILSTHSPILLGDMPQQNVIYLKTELNKHDTKVDDTVKLGTFGQNIHLLLQNSFFLEKGTMGRFAYDKIKEIFTELLKLEKSVTSLKEENIEEITEHFISTLEMYRQYIDLIAEPIIKQKLNSQIDKIYDKLPQEEKVKYLSDELLEKQLCLLQKEKDRRKLDK